MNKPKIVILRGKNASGKTTAFYNLRDYSFKDKNILKNWIFIDNNSIKRMFSNLDDENWKDISKDILFYVLKKVLPLRRNVIVEETSKETLHKYLKKEIAQNNYQIITFQFEVSLKNAIERDKERVKTKQHIGLGKEKIEELRKIHEGSFDKESIVINTDKMNQEEVVNFILKNIQ